MQSTPPVVSRYDTVAVTFMPVQQAVHSDYVCPVVPCRDWHFLFTFHDLTDFDEILGSNHYHQKIITGQNWKRQGSRIRQEIRIDVTATFYVVD